MNHERTKQPGGEWVTFISSKIMRVLSASTILLMIISVTNGTEVPTYARVVAAQMDGLASTPITATIFTNYDPKGNFQDAVAAVESYLQDGASGTRRSVEGGPVEDPWISENIAWALEGDWPDEKIANTRTVLAGSVDGVAYSLSTYAKSDPSSQIGFAARSLRIENVYFTLESLDTGRKDVASTEIIYVMKNRPARGDWIDIDKLLLGVAKRIHLADNIRVSETSDANAERVTIETIQEGIEANFVFDGDFMLREATLINPGGHMFRLWTFGNVSVGNAMLPGVLLRLQELPNGGFFMRLAKIEPAAKGTAPANADHLIEVGPGTAVQDGRVDQRTVAELDATTWKKVFADRTRVGMIEYVEAATDARLRRERGRAR